MLLAAVLAGTGCMLLPENPYDESMLGLEVQLAFPDWLSDSAAEGIEVTVEETTTANRSTALTDADGRASFRVLKGVYRAWAVLRTDDAVFNGLTEGIRLTEGDVEVLLEMTFSRPGALVIKEIYCGGCSKSPQEGSFQGDKYFIIHNNSSDVQFLDGLCWGMLDPYNSNVLNVWADQSGRLRDYAPLCEAVWRFGGGGADFPLAAGADAVVAVNGAVDHSAQYPLSVNLNCEDYFVCYDPLLFGNTAYHPAPGDKIRPERYLEVVRKTGQANAFPLSINSPTIVLFRAPEGTDIAAYLNDDTQSIVQKPGASSRCMKIPWDWIIEGVEVYNGAATSNYKRLANDVDAGYVYLSGTFTGHTLHRRLNEEASSEAGREIYHDTNNSSNDFYERGEQSLHGR